MTRIISLVTISVLLILGTFSSFAQEESEFAGQIEARQSFMRVYAFNLGLLGAMAKGEVAYDAKVAAAAAGNLKILSSINAMAMWPKGSDNAAMADKTRALPNIWAEFPKVAEADKALSAAVDNLASMAGKDLASLQAGIGAVGKACGGCHKPFRAEKK